MSFNTNHNLTWETEPPTRDEFIELVGPMMLDTPPGPGQALYDNEYEKVNNVISGIEVAKWYDSDHHIAVCSQNWPEVVFTLHCAGEDGGLWVTFFRNGRAQTITLDPPQFDPAEFERLATVPVSIADHSRQIHEASS